MGPNRGGGKEARAANRKASVAPKLGSGGASSSNVKGANTGNAGGAGGGGHTKPAKAAKAKKSNPTPASKKPPAAPLPGVSMSGENQARVRELLNSLGVDEEALGPAPAAVKLDEEGIANVQRRVVADLSKKGFSAAAVDAALVATEAQARSSADYTAVGFGDNKHSRTARVLDHLLVSLPEAELPFAFRQADGGNGSGGSRRAVPLASLWASTVPAVRAQPPAAASPVPVVVPAASSAATSSSSVSAAVMPHVLAPESSAGLAASTTTALVAAGFDATAARSAVKMYARNPQAALEYLCGTLSKPLAPGMRDALMGGNGGRGGRGSGMCGVRAALDDELEALEAIVGPDDCAGCRAGSSAVTLCVVADDIPGSGVLEVMFDAAGLYPFEPPSRLRYRNEALPFADIAAISAGVCRRALQLCGGAMLHKLLIWLRESAAGEVARAQKFVKAGDGKGKPPLPTSDPFAPKPRLTNQTFSSDQQAAAAANQASSVDELFGTMKLQPMKRGSTAGDDLFAPRRKVTQAQATAAAAAAADAADAAADEPPLTAAEVEAAAVAAAPSPPVPPSRPTSAGPVARMKVPTPAAAPTVKATPAINAALPPHYRAPETNNWVNGIGSSPAALAGAERQPAPETNNWVNGIGSSPAALAGAERQPVVKTAEGRNRRRGGMMAVVEGSPPVEPLQKLNGKGRTSGTLSSPAAMHSNGHATAAHGNGCVPDAQLPASSGPPGVAHSSRPPGIAFGSKDVHEYANGRLHNYPDSQAGLADPLNSAVPSTSGQNSARSGRGRDSSGPGLYLPPAARHSAEQAAKRQQRPLQQLSAEQQQQQQQHFGRPPAAPVAPRRTLEQEAASRQARSEATLRADVAQQGPRQAVLSRSLTDWRDSSDPKLIAMRMQRERLPAWKQREQVVEAIRANQVVVVSGETGCGKTTQVPQFLLDHAIDNGQGGATNIVCTQPRRISATSVAQRIAAERGESLGQTVGYAIRMESRRSAATRLLLCTTGVLLRRLMSDPQLAGVSHVIVDEVHERSLESDFLLILLKELLPRRPDLRLVLMSATVNEANFCSYFGSCPALNIPGFTHPVKEFFLEDVLEMIHWEPSPRCDVLRRSDGSGGLRGAALEEAERARVAEGAAIAGLKAKGYTDPTLKTLRAVDPEKVNYELATALLAWIADHGAPGAVLVFMPGLMEITRLHEACMQHPTLRRATSNGTWLIGLHSALSTNEQQAIFERPPNGVRKVVIATNIAETSITIDDVTWVVDAGRVKENRHTHEAVMSEYQIPEILRVPLEGLVLQIKMMRLGGESVEAFLSKALDAPSADAVTAAMHSLTAIGALDEAGRDLTPLGMHLANLPVDVRVGKMLIYAAMLGCLSPVATIAAAMTSRSPFVSPLDKRAEADAAKLSFSRQSDHLAVLAAFDQWEEIRNSSGRAAERSFCSSSFLSSRALEGIAELRHQFRRLLTDAGFVNTSSSRYGSNANGSSSNRRGSSFGYGGGGSNRGSATDLTSTGFGEMGDLDGGGLPDRGGRSALGAADAHSDNLRLVVAALVAGLYPHVARVDVPAGKSKPRLFARSQLQSGEMEEQVVIIHPCSVNHGNQTFASPWLVYAEKVQSTAVYLRDSTVVSPYPLLLFGGTLQVQHDAQTVTVDNWVRLACAPKVAVLFKELRVKLDRLLQDKIERPEVDIWETGGAVIATILHLITTEELQAPGRQ